MQMLRKILFIIGLLLLTFVHIAFVQAQLCVNRMTLAGFEDPAQIRLMGIATKNPLDEGQDIKMSIVDEDVFEKEKGKTLKLDYNVDSWEQAKVEFWIDLEQKDLSAFDTLHLYMRGDPEKGCTKNVMLQFMDGDNRIAPYIVTAIQSHWSEFIIPFKRFSRIRDWSHMKEFRIVFDDINSNPKEGTLYIDEISVSSKDKI